MERRGLSRSTLRCQPLRCLITFATPSLLDKIKVRFEARREKGSHGTCNGWIVKALRTPSSALTLPPRRMSTMLQSRMQPNPSLPDHSQPTHTRVRFFYVFGLLTCSLPFPGHSNEYGAVFAAHIELRRTDSTQWRKHANSQIFLGGRSGGRVSGDAEEVSSHFTDTSDGDKSQRGSNAIRGIHQGKSNTRLPRTSRRIFLDLRREE
ncbi:hypothetical protein BU16DRAFT_535441 [Lophium mytilinum]|uniref:Uncharacterized protein n=1 Tax=Lophium mytilinum TaxID=390894 RepID=A0A6A6R5J9_9PEZI|nr:hypothetical protein BU16DRAFT_535441 [Lophium mytilinum]